MIVVADTSPLNYLIQIQCDDLLPRLYKLVAVPLGVVEELKSFDAPAAVRSWISNPPGWLAIHLVNLLPDSELNRLGRGEREAIFLAEEQRATLLLIDERKGRAEASRRGLATTGTLGVLLDCGRAGLIDPSQAYRRLIAETTFRTTPALEARFLQRLRS